MTTSKQKHDSYTMPPVPGVRRHTLNKLHEYLYVVWKDFDEDNTWENFNGDLSKALDSLTDGNANTIVTNYGNITELETIEIRQHAAELMTSFCDYIKNTMGYVDKPS